MDLKTDDNQYLISTAEKQIRDEQDRLAWEIRNKFFALGRLIDKFVKLSERLPKNVKR